jgi:hypothetical protein
MAKAVRRGYPSDVTDEEWAFVLPYLLLCRGDSGHLTEIDLGDFEYQKEVLPLDLSTANGYSAGNVIKSEIWNENRCPPVITLGG